MFPFARRRTAPNGRTLLCVEALEGRDVPAMTITNFTIPTGNPVAGMPLVLGADIDNDQIMAHISMIWNWGDQSPVENTEIEATPPTTQWHPEPMHTYVSAGTYVVTVTVDSVNDGVGHSYATATYEITVAGGTVPPPPTSPPPPPPPPPGVPPTSPPPPPSVSGNIVALPTDGSAATHEGWVAENNDNDNYNFYGDPTTSLNQMFDKDEFGQVIGENDLVAIRVDPISGAQPGDSAKLHFTSPNIRIWPSADKNGWPIISDMPFLNPLDTTTLYIEGLNLSASLNAEEIDLVYVSADAAVPHLTLSTLTITVWKVTGASNVPGHSIHVYEATIPGPAGATWAAIAHGTITALGGNAPLGSSTVNTASIRWSAGAEVGTVKVNAPAGFSMTKEVNVVKVGLDIAGVDNELALDSMHQKQRDGEKRVVMSSSDAQIPAMSASLKVSEATGPVVAGSARGARFIDLGWMQSATVVHKHGDYNDSSPAFRVSTSMEGHIYIDSGASTKPWYSHSTNNATPGARHKAMGDTGLAATLFGMDDSPEFGAVNALTVDNDHVDFFSIVVNFHTYFAVHTKETTNAADDSYTIRATVNWSWNGSGTVNNTNSIWTPSPGIVPLSTTADPKKLTESTDGTILPTVLTKGTRINDAFTTQTWERTNQ